MRKGVRPSTKLELPKLKPGTRTGEQIQGFTQKANKKSKKEHQLSLSMPRRWPAKGSRQIPKSDRTVENSERS